VKAREIFIYLSHVQALAARIEGLREARVAIGRRDGRDEITVEVLTVDAANRARWRNPWPPLSARSHA
jgi:hypothetical protein